MSFALAELTCSRKDDGENLFSATVSKLIIKVISCKKKTQTTECFAIEKLAASTMASAKALGPKTKLSSFAELCAVMECTTFDLLDVN
jgi:DNA-binding Xre family transcriptional regulator